MILNRYGEREALKKNIGQPNKKIKRE